MLIYVHYLLFLYFFMINLITFLLFGIDKRKAIKQRSRVSEKKLLSFCLIGGSIGGYVGMYFFRHKTKKPVFVIGVPVIIILQVLAIFYLINL